MSDENTHTKKKKSKKSSNHSDEESVKTNKAEIEHEVEEGDEEKRKEHKRKHKKHKHDKKSEDEAEQDDEKETSAPTCKNKKSDATNEKSQDPSIEIHSANNWEKAELDGDEKRKLKFLKLMGATKQKESATPEETNKTVQHQHSRPTTEIKKIDQDLEKQFTESLTSKINRTNHVGLGFGGSTGFAHRPQSNTHKKFDDEDEPQKKSEAPSTSTSTEAVKEDPKLKFKKMTFVKSNN